MGGVLEDLKAAVEVQSAMIDALTREVAALREKIQPQREVFGLRDLAELPESPSLKVLRNHPERQPNHGLADGYRGASKCWRAETVLAWRRELMPGPSGAPQSGLHIVQEREA